MENLTYNKLCNLIALSHRQSKIFIINRHNNNVLFVNNNNRTLVLNNIDDIKDLKDFIINALNNNQVKFIRAQVYARKTIVYAV